MEYVSIILLTIGILSIVCKHFEDLKQDEEFKDVVLCELDKQRKDIEALKEEIGLTRK